jgi:hypothetical protein
VKFLGFRLLLFILIETSSGISAQSFKERKEIFNQAEIYFMREEFDLANSLYLLLETPDNMNIKYKIGTCYLYIENEKQKSIGYLEEAARNASYDSKTESLNELRAPIDAYLSLAKAYMINNELMKGFSSLQTFRKLAGGTSNRSGIWNLTNLDQLTQSYKNAIRFIKNPVVFDKTSLGIQINQGSFNEYPAVSYDGNTIVYTERRGLINALFYSKQINNEWQTPIEITKMINAGEDCSSCSLNRDGTELFIYKTDNYDGALYSSKFENGSWTSMIKLNDHINTKYYESHAAISYDGRKLYFTSNRPGGQGFLDIYVSVKDRNGDWGPAVNLGPAINTPYNEDTPFITKNDSVLYFCSAGHNSMGGYDIFRSQRTLSSWKTPENLGFPINTPDDDRFFQPMNNGSSAYYTMSNGYKKRDIFYLNIGNSYTGKLFEIKGKLSLSDTIRLFNENYYIFLVNKNNVTNDTLDINYPNMFTGFYSFTVNPGKFRLVYMGPGYKTQTIDTTIHQDNPSPELIIDVSLEKDNSLKKEVSTSALYEKINFKEIPIATSLDPNIIIKNLNINDLNDKNINDSDVLYYTIQLIATHNPVNTSFFKYITDLEVIYNDTDKFYRYTTGTFLTRKEAYTRRLHLIEKGYPQEIFIKKVSIK